MHTYVHMIPYTHAMRTWHTWCTYVPYIPYTSHTYTGHDDDDDDEAHGHARFIESDFINVQLGLSFYVGIDL